MKDNKYLSRSLVAHITSHPFPLALLGPSQASKTIEHFASFPY